MVAHMALVQPLSLVPKLNSQQSLRDVDFETGFDLGLAVVRTPKSGNGSLFQKPNVVEK